MDKELKPSELVLAPDGSLYHIRLTSSTLADKVLLVGDPGRVDMFKEIFEKIEFESNNREMHALTGTYHGARLTALSTGMGCDNIDIVMTELDVASAGRKLHIVRIGTSGSLQAETDCGSRVASARAIGLDGLMNYYREWDSPLPEMEAAFAAHMGLSPSLARPYCVQGSKKMLDGIAHDMKHGITATAPGFYGPQGRTIRLHPSIDNLNEKLSAFQWSESQKVKESKSQRDKESKSQKAEETLRPFDSSTFRPFDSSTFRPFDSSTLKVTNLEMETSAIYGFSHMMGHEALTVCLIIANRPRGTFLNDYHPQMRELVGTISERLAAL